MQKLVGRTEQKVRRKGGGEKKNLPSRNIPSVCPWTCTKGASGQLSGAGCRKQKHKKSAHRSNFSNKFPVISSFLPQTSPPPTLVCEYLRTHTHTQSLKRKMSLNVSWWWMAELPPAVFLTTLDTHLIKGTAKNKKNRKETIFFFFPLSFFFWKVCVIAATTCIMGHISPHWQHAANAAFGLHVVASGHEGEEQQQNPSWGCFVAHLYTSILPLRERRRSGNAGLSHAPISPSQSEGFSEPCRVFNMEIGFEPHLHRSAHLRAKLRYRWQGKWTINSL